jgi:hypothetical protein
MVNWLRRLFSSTSPEEEAVEREEYGLPDRGDDERRRFGFGSLAGEEASEAAEDELDEFKAPPDPAP